MSSKYSNFDPFYAMVYEMQLTTSSDVARYVFDLNRGNAEAALDMLLSQGAENIERKFDQEQARKAEFFPSTATFSSKKTRRQNKKERKATVGTADIAVPAALTAPATSAAAPVFVAPQSIPHSTPLHEDRPMDRPVQSSMNDDQLVANQAAQPPKQLPPTNAWGTNRLQFKSTSAHSSSNPSVSASPRKPTIPTQTYQERVHTQFMSTRLEMILDVQRLLFEQGFSTSDTELETLFDEMYLVFASSTSNDATYSQRAFSRLHYEEDHDIALLTASLSNKITRTLALSSSFQAQLDSVSPTTDSSHQSSVQDSASLQVQLNKLSASVPYHQKYDRLLQNPPPQADVDNLAPTASTSVPSVLSAAHIPFTRTSWTCFNHPLSAHELLLSTNNTDNFPSSLLPRDDASIKNMVPWRPPAPANPPSSKPPIAAASPGPKTVFSAEIKAPDLFSSSFMPQEYIQNVHSKKTQLFTLSDFYEYALAHSRRKYLNAANSDPEESTLASQPFFVYHAPLADLALNVRIENNSISSLLGHLSSLSDELFNGIFDWLNPIEIAMFGLFLLEQGALWQFEWSQVVQPRLKHAQATNHAIQRSTLSKQYNTLFGQCHASLLRLAAYRSTVTTLNCSNVVFAENTLPERSSKRLSHKTRELFYNHVPPVFKSLATAHTLPLLPLFPNLTALTIKASSIKASSTSPQLAQLQHLRQLSLFGISHLKQWQTLADAIADTPLSELNLVNCQITLEVVSLLRSKHIFHRLNSLSIEKPSDSFSNSCFNCLCQSGIPTLVLRHCSSLTDSIWATVSSLTPSQQQSVASSQLSYDDMSSAQHYLSPWTTAAPRGLTNLTLSHCPNLNFLWIKSTNLLQLAVTHCGLHNTYIWSTVLLDLNISGNGGMKYLSLCTPALQWLNCAECSSLRSFSGPPRESRNDLSELRTGVAATMLSMIRRSIRDQDDDLVTLNTSTSQRNQPASQSNSNSATSPSLLPFATHDNTSPLLDQDSKHAILQQLMPIISYNSTSAEFSPSIASLYKAVVPDRSAHDLFTIKPTWQILSGSITDNLFSSMSSSQSSNLGQDNTMDFISESNQENPIQTTSGVVYALLPRSDPMAPHVLADTISLLAPTSSFPLESKPSETNTLPLPMYSSNARPITQLQHNSILSSFGLNLDDSRCPCWAPLDFSLLWRTALEAIKTTLIESYRHSHFSSNSFHIHGLDYALSTQNREKFQDKIDQSEFSIISFSSTMKREDQRLLLATPVETAKMHDYSDEALCTAFEGFIKWCQTNVTRAYQSPIPRAESPPLSSAAISMLSKCAETYHMLVRDYERARERINKRFHLTQHAVLQKPACWDNWPLSNLPHGLFKPGPVHSWLSTSFNPLALLFFWYRDDLFINDSSPLLLQLCSYYDIAYSGDLINVARMHPLQVHARRSICTPSIFALAISIYNIILSASYNTRLLVKSMLLWKEQQQLQKHPIYETDAPLRPTTISENSGFPPTQSLLSLPLMNQAIQGTIGPKTTPINLFPSLRENASLSCSEALEFADCEYSAVLPNLRLINVTNCRALPPSQLQHLITCANNFNDLIYFGNASLSHCSDDEKSPLAIIGWLSTQTKTAVELFAPLTGHFVHIDKSMFNFFVENACYRALFLRNCPYISQLQMEATKMNAQASSPLVQEVLETKTLLTQSAHLHQTTSCKLALAQLSWPHLLNSLPQFSFVISKLAAATVPVSQPQDPTDSSLAIVQNIIGSSPTAAASPQDFSTIIESIFGLNPVLI